MLRTCLIAVAAFLLLAGILVVTILSIGCEDRGGRRHGEPEPHRHEEPHRR